MFKIKTVKGLEWTEGAISTASWTGPRLLDVLRSVGADLSDTRIKHVQADGLDLDPTSKPYGASIPSQNALDPRADVIVALKMNDQPIPRDHGFPVRLIVPGVVGARNVKWLSAIRLAGEESDSHWQQADYKGFIPQMDYDNVDFRHGFSIQSLPVQSAICSPADNSRVQVQQLRSNGNRLELSGYAWSGGGRRIVRVDVSTDEGKTWRNANIYGESEYRQEQELERQLHSGLLTNEQFEAKRRLMLKQYIDQSTDRSWCWVLWKADVRVDEDQLKPGNEMQVICKAVDSHYNCQPERVEALWNFRGVLNNAWHRIRVQFE
jgi:sulfite oxidase